MSKEHETIRHDKMENMDRSLLERVNPVFLTAKMALCGLAMSGDKDASDISEKLNLPSFEKPDLTTPSTAPEHLSAMRDTANSVFLEIRFRTVGAMAEKSDCATIVDLPCGYTPRGIQMSRKNKRYIGLDLPAAISEAKRVIMPMIKSENLSLIRYDAADATNYESLETALAGSPGPICITTEGLLMYFNNHETASLCDNVRRLLSKYGGCWITSDPEMMIQNTLVMRAIAGDRYQEIIDSLVRGFESKADIHVETPKMMILPWKNQGKDIASDTDEALAFLSDRGLQAERLVVGKYMPEIRSLSWLDSEVAEAVKAGMENCAYWRITLKPEEKKDWDKELITESFTAQAVLKEDTLEMSLQGRVDTLSAPEVLELYEKVSRDGAFSDIVIDCGKLNYISSAGLRVLLIMQKEHDVKLKAVNRSVKEILETTGFDSIIAVEDEHTEYK